MKTKYYMMLEIKT